MKEFAQEEIASIEARMPQLEEDIKFMLIPSDPADEKDIIVEIRAAAGGDEFAMSRIDPKLYLISALTGEGVESLKAAIGSKVRELREQAREELAASEVQYDRVWELKREKRDKAFKVRKLSDGIFRVEGPQVERMVVQTDWENEEALAFLQHRFKRLGVDKALENAGARNGDEVRILGYAFEFESAAGIDDPYQELEL